MQESNKEVKTQNVTTKTTHTVDAFMRREVKDAETGKTEVKVVRWQEGRQVGATLQTADGGVFHRGARIA